MGTLDSEYWSAAWTLQALGCWWNLRDIVRNIPIASFVSHFILPLFFSLPLLPLFECELDFVCEVLAVFALSFVCFSVLLNIGFEVVLQVFVIARCVCGCWG